MIKNDSNGDLRLFCRIISLDLAEIGNAVTFCKHSTSGKSLAKVRDRNVLDQSDQRVLFWSTCLEGSDQYLWVLEWRWQKGNIWKEKCYQGKVPFKTTTLDEQVHFQWPLSVVLYGHGCPVTTKFAQANQYWLSLILDSW